MTNKEILYPVYDCGELHISISQGNRKMGNIPAFNLLPANEPLTLSNGKILTNIKGTCGKHCAQCKNDCYAVRYIKMHHNSCVVPYAGNTIIMRNEPDKLRKEIKEYCDKNIVKYFRFHTSGEIESIEQLTTYCNICDDNPDVIFYIYTKAFELLQEWIDNGRKFPKNFVINLSEWGDNSKDLTFELLQHCNVFTYDDSKGMMDNLIHCPAVDIDGHETGITCAQCRRCMRKGTATLVYAH